MSNQDWNEMGDQISKLVQDAIDSEDFSKLSNAIQNTVSSVVSEAVNGVTKGMSTAGDSLNRAIESMKKREGSIPAAQNPWRGNGNFERKTTNYFGTKDIPNNELFSPGGATRASGYVLSILGGLGCFGFGISLMVLWIISLVSGIGMSLPIWLMVPFLVLSIVMTILGSRTLGRLSRFKRYVRLLGGKLSMKIADLALGVGKSERYVLRDIKQMIEKNMFRQGHVDLNGKELFVSDASYQEYIQEQKRAVDAQRRELDRQAAADQYKTNEALSEDVRQLIADGNGYIEMIRKSNDAIRDEHVTEKLNDLEVTIRKIFQYVEQHPESAADTKKLMKYYLPTTIKLLDSYQKLTDQPVQGENIAHAKMEIEVTLDTLNQAFARLFDNMYRETSMDISADISVLNTLLAQEGLTGKGI